MKSGTVFLVGLGLLISLAGAIFTWLMWGSFRAASAQRDWPQVEATVLESQIEEHSEIEYAAAEYQLKILYGYEFEGERYTSTRLSVRGNPRYKTSKRIEDLVVKFPVGSQTTAYVNPTQPDFAILKLDSKAAGYSIWFPLIFVIGGFGICLGTIIKRKQ